ncbi:MAG: Ig-like domain-containing protein [Gammaproteobacteria bacterium]
MNPGHSQRLSVLGMGLLAVACGPGPSPTTVPRVARAIVVEPAIVSMPAGSRAQLAAQVNDNSGQPIGGSPITFESANPVIASVSATGLVTASGPAGETTVRVASGIRSAEVTVRIGPGAPAALDIVQGPKPAAQVSRLIGEIQVVVRDELGNPVSGAPLTWQTTGKGGTLEGTSERTGPEGIGTARWIAGSAPGDQALAVQSGSIPPQVLRTVVGPGPPAMIRINIDPPLTADSLEVGASRQVRIRVVDEFGNSVPDAQVLLTSGRGCGLDAINLVSDGEGNTAATEWVPGSAGSCTLIARIGDPAIEAKVPVKVVRAAPAQRER